MRVSGYDHRFVSETTNEGKVGKMGKEGWQLLEVIMAGGGFVAFLKFCQWLIDKLLWQRRRAGLVDGLAKLREVYVIMEQAVEMGSEEGPQCGRVLLLAAHNSGGIPSPSSPFYATALHWVTSDPDKRKALNTYNNVKVDRYYIDMLLKMQADGFYHFDMSENENSVLRSYYESEGVKDGVLYFIGIRDNRFIYMSFCSFEGVFNKNQLTRFGLVANEIRQRVMK